MKKLVISLVVIAALCAAACCAMYFCGQTPQPSQPVTASPEPAPEPPSTPPIALVPNDEVVEEIVEEEPEPTPTPTPAPTPTPTPTPAPAQAEPNYNGWPAIPEWQLPQPDKPSGDTVIVIPAGQQTSRDATGILPDQNVIVVPNAHAASDPSSHDWLAEEIFLLTNKERVAGGLKELGYAYDLQDVADTRAMEASVQFSHTRPNGQSCHDMITKDCKVTGENLILADKPIATAANLVAEWMNSPGHRYNIMLPDYTGMAVGIFEYNGVLYAAQIFIG